MVCHDEFMHTTLQRLGIVFLTCLYGNGDESRVRFNAESLALPFGQHHNVTYKQRQACRKKKTEVYLPNSQPSSCFMSISISISMFIS